MSVEPTDRLCITCGAPLFRKRNKDHSLEKTEHWNRRRFCNHSCAARGRSRSPIQVQTGVAQYDSIDWDPIVFDSPPTDRCWAGFVAGCRCVLPRGDHVTHRDSTGREFLRAERRDTPSIERNTGTNQLLDIVNLRNTWRSRVG